MVAWREAGGKGLEGAAGSAPTPPTWGWGLCVGWEGVCMGLSRTGRRNEAWRVGEGEPPAAGDTLGTLGDVVGVLGDVLGCLGMLLGCWGMRWGYWGRLGGGCWLRGALGSG